MSVRHSRAYYATYHHMHTFAVKSLGHADSRSGGNHRALINRYRDFHDRGNQRSVSMNAKPEEIKEFREQADYHRDFHVEDAKSIEHAYHQLTAIVNSIIQRLSD